MREPARLAIMRVEPIVGKKDKRYVLRAGWLINPKGHTGLY